MSQKYTEYTSGPWTYDQTWALIKGPKGEEVCACHSGQGDGARVNRHIAYANAALIAAAPDLLEACKATLAYIQDHFGMSPEGQQQRNEARDMLKAAIAKATSL